MKNQIRTILNLLLITLLALQFSCKSPQQNASNTLILQNSKSDLMQSKAIESEFERNRRLWQENKITNYKLTLESAIADALYTTLSPVEIEVREGKAVSVRHLAKVGKSVTIDEAKDIYGLMLYERRGVATIEGMFNLIKQAEEGKTGKGALTSLLEVEYDPKFGYPVSIKFDQAATDSSIFLRVRKFEIIE